MWADADPEVVEAVDRERAAERDREQQHREGPDQIERPRDDPVHPAPVEAGKQREQDRDHDADQGRADSDLQRVETTVEQSYGYVAAEAVRAEHEAPVRVPPGRAEHTAGLLDDNVALCVGSDHRSGEHLLAVDDVLGMRGVRGRVRDVVRVDRRERAGHRDHDEDEERDECDVVPPQAPPGQVPRAAPDDRGSMLFLGENLRGVEREVGSWLRHASRECKSLHKQRAPTRAPSGLRVQLGNYFRQTFMKSMP